MRFDMLDLQWMKHVGTVRAPRRRIIILRMAVGSSLRRFRLLAAILSGGGFIFARMYPRGRLSGTAGFRRAASLFGLMWAFDTWWHFLLL